LAKADSIAPDGVPILWGASLAGRPLPGRIATTDVFHDFARAASAHGISFFFFGGTEEVNAKAVATVRALYPELKIAGARHGYFAPQEEDRVIAEISATKPDIVWVGLGIPRQELFVARNLEKFVGATWVKTCGGLFDFLAGRVSRAPGWMQRMGLEWVYRVYLEPRRLFWRYFSTTPHALYRMVIATPRVHRK
jgi:exopolysaccharide biosynthesis WecB/TagA/CpsF family protein